MQQAIAGVREGVLQAASGAAALRAVDEGEPPRQIALTWFKGLTGLPTDESSAMVAEFWNLSWYHVMTMIFLVAFLAWSVVVHFARSRRIAALVEELKTGAPG